MHTFHANQQANNQTSRSERSFQKKNISQFKNVGGIKICITSGSEKVGKTSIAIRAAMELSLQGYRTLLVDCEGTFASAYSKLGLVKSGNLERCLAGEIPFNDILFKKDQFDVLLANADYPCFSKGRLNFEEILSDIIKFHSHEFDFILVDCPNHLKEKSLFLGAICDYRWMIVTPERESLLNSYTLIKLLNQEYGITENHILINMFQDEKQFIKISSGIIKTLHNFLGTNTLLLGGMPEYHFNNGGFDTFFLSKKQNETNLRFAKLIFEFTEKALGTLSTQNLSLDQ